MRPHHRRHLHHRVPHQHLHGRTLRGTLLRSFVAAVVVTGGIVSGLFFAFGDHSGFTNDVARTAHHAAAAVAGKSDDEARAVFTNLSVDFATRFVWRREGDAVFAVGDGECRRPVVVPLGRPGDVLEACRPMPQLPPVRGVVTVVAVIGVLAVLSSAMARRIARPLRALADTARRIGEGDLSARAPLGRRPFVEVRLVGDALQEMAERIEREMQGQRALLAGASHELRTPLGHLRLVVETARERLETAHPEVDLKHLDDIEREVHELDTLLEKLLAQARLDFARIDRRPTDLVDVVRRAVERAGVDASIVKAPSSLPLMQGDATLLLRAVGNLVENAAHHGSGVTAVSIDVDADHGFVNVVVDDEGDGVADADRARIFEPFVHRNDRGKGALGLGLHLVRRIAEAHGGHVDVVDKAPGAKGARFVLSLPL